MTELEQALRDQFPLRETYTFANGGEIVLGQPTLAEVHSVVHKAAEGSGLDIILDEDEQEALEPSAKREYRAKVVQRDNIFKLEATRICLAEGERDVDDRLLVLAYEQDAGFRSIIRRFCGFPEAPMSATGSEDERAAPLDSQEPTE